MVDSWGTGRVDFSENVEASVLPIVRSYQQMAYAQTTFTLAANETKDIDITLNFSVGSACHFIYKMEITVDKNVLIGVQILRGVLLYTTAYGYQQVIFDFPESFPTSPPLAIRIINKSGQSITGDYWHFGIQGTENIMPLPVAG